MKKTFKKMAILRSFLGLSGVVYLCSCASTHKASPEVVANAKPTFTYKEKKSVQLRDPLGNYRELEVTWQNANPGTPVNAHYRGWDFNGDQRVDMVEVFDKGSPHSVASLYIFDFDGDGTIDLVRSKKP